MKVSHVIDQNTAVRLSVIVIIGGSALWIAYATGVTMGKISRTEEKVDYLASLNIGVRLSVIESKIDSLSRRAEHAGLIRPASETVDRLWPQTEFRLPMRATQPMPMLEDQPAWCAIMHRNYCPAVN